MNATANIMISGETSNFFLLFLTLFLKISAESYIFCISKRPSPLPLYSILLQYQREKRISYN